VAQRRSPSQYLLRNNADIKVVFREGRRLPGPLFTLLYRGNVVGRTRFTVMAGKKMGGAVVRNRCKRRFRELARLSLGAMPAGWDLVILPKREAVTEPADSLRCAWQATLGRAKLLRRNGSP
jgi:ribonuclease P protein component